MLLRVSDTQVVNLNAYKDMRLMAPNERGLYFLRWARSGDEAFVLEVAKDRSAAQKIFDALATAWGGERRLLNWAEVARPLFQRVRLSPAWSSTAVWVRDIEPRFMVGGSPHGTSSQKSGKLLTSKDMQNLVTVMQSTQFWPPDGDNTWEPAFRDDDGEGDVVGEPPSDARRAELIGALQTALAS